MIDRRDFLKTAGAGVCVLARPGSLLAETMAPAGDAIEARARELVAAMSLTEKIEQMSGRLKVFLHPAGNAGGRMFGTPANKKRGLSGIRFTDGPRGVGLNHSTCFPVQMARGASWDPDLQSRVGEAMGYEARAQGANFSGAVCLNVLRHPAWGRAQETFGEDPYHLGRMGVALATGLQNHVMACAKHFACNSIEDSRFFVDVRVDERTLREIYLPHFKRCVDAGIASVMSAYNNLNGELCGQNRRLLTDILKKEWGFSGFVISDFLLGVENTAASANAGLDIEMPVTAYYGRKLELAVRAGRVAPAAIDEALTRIVRQQLRFAPLETASYDVKKVAGPEHTALAREAAQKSIVLLKNRDALLPLDQSRLKSLAVIGKLAAQPDLGDRGSSIVSPPYVITPLAGLSERAGSGLAVRFDPGDNPERAARLARESAAAIVVVGLTYKDEGEYMVAYGGDRDDLRLRRADEELIAAVAAANPRTIVALIGGSAIIMEAWRERVPAILMAWYPGMEGGHAIADIIFGDVNPSAKLPIVFPKSDDQLPFFDNRVKTIEYGYYHGYRLFDKKALEPAFPFGFGLAYTKYQYANLRLSETAIGQSGKLEVKVDVMNAGPRAGSEIVELYVGARGSRVDRPVKDLKGFGRLALAPGETRTLALELRPADLAYYNQGARAWEIEEIEYSVFVGPSSRQEDLLSAAFIISGP